MKLFTIFILSSLLTGSAFARTCFNKNMIRGFKVKSTHELTIYGVRTDYKVKVWPCHDLPHTDRLWFETVGDFSRTCVGDKILVLNHSNHVTDRCQIIEITETH